jgi:hypothetical protein
VEPLAELTCTSCGGTVVESSTAPEIFVCAYCHSVFRRTSPGAELLLLAVRDAVDRSSAELAYQRLSKEVSDLFAATEKAKDYLSFLTGQLEHWRFRRKLAEANAGHGVQSSTRRRHRDELNHAEGNVQRLERDVPVAAANVANLESRLTDKKAELSRVQGLLRY